MNHPDTTSPAPGLPRLRAVPPPGTAALAPAATSGEQPAAAPGGTTAEPGFTAPATSSLVLPRGTGGFTLGPAGSAAGPRSAWTASELMGMEFPEPRWAVPGFLAEGVSLLAGPPKVGKSWLSLSLGLSIAAGGLAFERVPVQAGPVLYLALEDTPRRLRNRIEIVLGDVPAPDGLTLATACPPFPSGGVAAIAAWLEEHPAARMVVIDVFAKMRGIPPAGMSAYDADYAAVGHAKRLADRYGVAVVLVHHVRKATAEDFLATVSGTNGIAGAADAVLVLERGRGRADGVLHITGRDVEEAEHALAFAPERGAWSLLDGPASDHTMGDTRATILGHLRASPGQGPSEIAAALQLDVEKVKKTCQRMFTDGELRRSGGRYFPAGDTAPP
ncbi:AAA family ATPase [Crossiella sp. CA198]|uniref:AAA family ATPase n=1 Tax=Crossiella sp. CA198 TaxID=3455607 RepID=UPI003F8D0D84